MNFIFISIDLPEGERTEPKGVGVATLFLGKAGIVGFPPHVKTACWHCQQRVLVVFHVTQLGDLRTGGIS